MTYFLLPFLVGGNLQNTKKHNKTVDFSFLFLCFSNLLLSFQIRFIVDPSLVSIFFSFALGGWRLQEKRPRGGCHCWAGFKLLFWSFAVEKTEEKDVVEEGDSVLLGLWAPEEQLEEGSLSSMGDGGATAVDFYG